LTSSQGTQPVYIYQERYSRQLPLVGPDRQRTLEGLTVAVVGLGGLGSFAALELAHLGIGKLLLIDPDRIEESNLNRLLGAGPGDVGRYKVEVYRDFIRNVAPPTDCQALAANVTATEALEALKAADVVLGCVDNHGARLVLNAFCLQHGLPYIDAGTGVRLGQEEQVHAGGQVQLALAGAGCLQCRGFINAQQAAFDLATPGQQASERERGYGTGQPAPSVCI
jgi:molybdopterin/thiamine biosynthesis adenylyltransferase